MKRILILLLIVGSSLAYADRYVAPTNAGAAPDYETWAKAATNIQDAVNAAAASETVWVTNGTYYLTNQVDVQANITIKSVNGRGVTIIDGNNYDGKPVTNRCFILRSGDVLDGFTVQNGYASGGGVYCDGARVINCRIANNFATNGGGAGIYAINSSQITNCQVTGNVSTNGSGGAGIHSYNSSIIGCEVSSNTRGTTANDNYGGGIVLIALSGSEGMISNCTVFANRVISPMSTCYAGGIYTDNRSGSKAIIICNSLIYGNSAYNAGGVWMSIDGSGAKIQNCTIVSNYAPGKAAGLYYQCYSPGGTAYVENVISYGNTGCTTSNFYALHAGGYNGQFSFINSCIAPTSGIGPTNLIIYTGMIESNPLFVDKNAGNWRLSKSSPCVNTGSNQAWMNGAGDLDGRMRIRYGTVDMGCYEHIHSGTIYGFQ